jgi:hypothetical protein
MGRKRGGEEAKEQTRRKKRKKVDFWRAETEKNSPARARFVPRTLTSRQHQRNSSSGVVCAAAFLFSLLFRCSLVSYVSVN